MKINFNPFAKRGRHVSNDRSQSPTATATEKTIPANAYHMVTIIHPGGTAENTFGWQTLKDAEFNADWQVSQYKGLIYDGINFIAKPAASTGYSMINANGEPIPNHPFEAVLENPLGTIAIKQGFTITYRDLIYTTVCDLYIFGNALWEVDNKRNPTWIVPLPPQVVEPVKNPQTGFVDKYIVSNNTPQRREIPAENVVHFQFIDPRYGPGLFPRFAWGKSPLQAHSDVLVINDKMNKLQSETMDKLGLPVMLAKVDGSKSGNTGEDDLDRIKNKLQNKFYDKKDKIAVIDIDLMDLVLLETKLNELQFVEGKSLTGHEIAAMFGIDPMFLGFNQTTNRAQADSAIYVFQRFTLAPLLQHIADQLNHDLIQAAYPGVTFVFDDVVDEDGEARRADWQMAFNCGAVTPNEIRTQVLKLEPLKITAMDKPYLTMAVLPIEYAESNATPEEPETITVTEEEPDTITVTDEEDEEETEDEEKSLGYITVIEPTIIECKMGRDTVNKNRRRYQALNRQIMLANEKHYIKTLSGIFERQMDGVDKRLRQVKDKSFILKRNVKPSDLDYLLYSVDDETLRTMKDMTESIKDLLLQSGLQRVEALNLPIDFDTISPRLLKLLQTGGRAEGVFKFAKEITDTTDINLRATLLEGIKAGEPIAELSKRIAAVKQDAQGFRAVRIARTEIIGGNNRAADVTVREAVEELGEGEPVKFWYTAAPAERETHNMNEAESIERDGVPIDEAFEANGLMFPGDPSGEAGEVINCRCALGHIIKGLGVQ